MARDAMKSSDWLILKQLDQIDKMLLVQNEKLNQIDEKLALLLKQGVYVIPELETAIRRVSVLAADIDRKVPDQTQTNERK
jgi:hypothetical protein